jgi:L-aminopeptidase/D-esterase-like protein
MAIRKTDRRVRAARNKAESGRAEKAAITSITDVPGIRVGHAHDLKARTGCTVALCDGDGAVAGVDVRGGAPGTRETDLLDPSSMVDRINAVLLAGGSAFGLDAATGVMRYLEERGIGYDAGVARVPIVPAAVIFDLAVGDSAVRPDAEMGYKACESARAKMIDEGQIGAGAGATVGKIMGVSQASRGGVGTASRRLPGGATVGVLVVVNAFGDIIDPRTGSIVAGARSLSGGWLDASSVIAGAHADSRAGSDSGMPNRFAAISNTTLAVVATDAALTKAQARKVAAMSHDGLARSIRPAHTMFDGDTIFALSTGEVKSDVSVVGAVAADLIARAVVRVGEASALAGV